MKMAYEDAMPPSVPRRCGRCPIRNWAEFFRELNGDGVIIADSIHEVLGESCPGSEDVRKEDDICWWTESVCRQERVQDGTLAQVIKAHFDEAGLVMSGMLVAQIAQQTANNEL